MTDWVFRNDKGEKMNPNRFIFPLTSPETPKQPFRVIGTAFLIAKPAIFLTARHVLYKDDACTDPWQNMIGILNEALHVRWSVVIGGTDVAIGQLETDNDEHPVMTLCEWTPVEKEKICHWGCDLTEISVLEQNGDEFHLHSSSKVRGVNGHFIEKKDKWPPFTQAECHVTSAATSHAASGGPVSLSSGQVFGISTSSSDLGGYSITSMVKHAIDSQIPPHFRLNGETKGRKQTWGEMLAEFDFEILRGT